MNDMVKDLEEDQEPTVTPEQLQEIIDNSGIKEMVDNIKADFKEEAKQVVEDLKDWDVTINDGIDQLETEEQEEPKTEPGLTTTKPERRRVKNNKSTAKREALKKGPLWDFRTNRSNDHLYED